MHIADPPCPTKCHNITYKHLTSLKATVMSLVPPRSHPNKNDKQGSLGQVITFLSFIHQLQVVEGGEINVILITHQYTN